MTPEEVSKLYSGYRGEAYFEQRHRAEPWYSRKVNNGIASDPQEIRSRNSAMASFLQPHLDGTKLNTVLDYGGDKGQFIPESIGKQKFVYELSDATPVDGVVRISSDIDLDGRRFDLIFLLGVLEHCSDPMAVLRKVRTLLEGSDSYLVIGVPYEWYSLDSVSNSAFYKAYLNALLKARPILKLVDFYSTVIRVRSYRIPPLGIVKCHEHLNFFNEKSMTALLEAVGFEVVACSTTQTCSYPARTFSLNVLARLIKA